MKKIAPKEISQKVGRTPTGKSINNISLMNKRGVSSEEQNNKSLYKNYLEYKKSIPHLDKTISKLIITEIANDQTKENNNSLLNKKALVATSSISNLNSILNNINCFDILEKIFVFIKPNIPFDLFVNQINIRQNSRDSLMKNLIRSKQDQSILIYFLTAPYLA